MFVQMICARDVQPQFEVMQQPMHKMGFPDMNSGLCTIFSQCTNELVRDLQIPSRRSPIETQYSYGGLRRGDYLAGSHLIQAGAQKP